MISRLSILLFCSFITSNAIASIISGPQTTSNGKVVNLSGLEWLSLDQTVGYSKTSIEDGSAGNWLANGWRYSTRTETEALLDSLWGGTTEGWYWDNYDGASWFGDNFGKLGTYTDHLGHEISEMHFFFAGNAGATSNSFVGSVRLDINPTSTSLYASKGFFMDGFGLSVGTDQQGINEQFITSGRSGQYNQGSLLVRTASVPEPSSFFLVLAFIMVVISKTRTATSI